MSTWQDVLVAIPDRMGWSWFLLWGGLSLTAAGIMFVHLIKDEPMSWLLAGRVSLGLGLVMIPLTALQPGWIYWLVAFYSIGGFITSVLIATNWCNRPDQSLSVSRAIGRWIVAKLDALHDRVRQREDAL